MACEDEMIRKQQPLLRNDFQEEKPEPKAKPELDYVEKRKPFKLRVKPQSATQTGEQQRPTKCTRCGKSPAHRESVISGLDWTDLCTLVRTSTL